MSLSPFKITKTLAMQVLLSNKLNAYRHADAPAFAVEYANIANTERVRCSRIQRLDTKPPPSARFVHKSEQLDFARTVSFACSAFRYGLFPHRELGPKFSAVIATRQAGHPSVCVTDGHRLAAAPVSHDLAPPGRGFMPVDLLPLVKPWGGPMETWTSESEKGLLTAHFAIGGFHVSTPITGESTVSSPDRTPPINWDEIAGDLLQKHRVPITTVTLPVPELLSVLEKVPAHAGSVHWQGRKLQVVGHEGEIGPWRCEALLPDPVLASQSLDGIDIGISHRYLLAAVEAWRDLGETEVPITIVDGDDRHPIAVGDTKLTKPCTLIMPVRR